jgi:hypothetical protein
VVQKEQLSYVQYKFHEFKCETCHH